MFIKTLALRNIRLAISSGYSKLPTDFTLISITIVKPHLINFFKKEDAINYKHYSHRELKIIICNLYLSIKIGVFRNKDVFSPKKRDPEIFREFRRGLGITDEKWKKYRERDKMLMALEKSKAQE